MDLKKIVLHSFELLSINFEDGLQVCKESLKEAQGVLLESLKPHFEKFQKSQVAKEFVSEVHGKSQTQDKEYQQKVDSIMNANLEGVILNSYFQWTITARHPMTVATDLLETLLKLIQQKEFWVIGSKGLLKFSRDKLIEDRRWKCFKEATSELSKVNLNVLKKEEYIPFFINCYNLLIIDSAITTSGIPSTTLSRALFVRKAKYMIGGLDFSLDQILYGVLLNNRSVWILGKRFKYGDERLKFVCNAPIIILFALCDLTQSSPKVKILTSEKFEENLELIAKNYVLKNIKFNDQTNTFTCSYWFQQYSAEFKLPKYSEQESLLEYVFKYWNFIKKDRKFKIVFDQEDADTSFLCVLSSNSIKNIIKRRKSIYICPETGGKYFGELLIGRRDSLKQLLSQSPINKSGNFINLPHLEDEDCEDAIKIMHGYGELYLKNGNRYFGSFINNKRHGYGVYIGNDFRYYGMWFENEMEGEGVYLYDDGTYFKGMFKKGERNGQGTIYFSTGDCIEGTWTGDNIQNAHFKKGSMNDASKCSSILLREMILKLSTKFNYGVLKTNDIISKWNINSINFINEKILREKFITSSDYHSLKSELTNEKIELIAQRLINGEFGQLVNHFVEIFHFNFASITESNSRKEKPKALDDFFDFVNEIYKLLESFMGKESIKFYGNNFMKSWIKSHTLPLIYKPLFTIYKDRYKERDLALKIKLLSFTHSTTQDFGIKQKLVPKGDEPFSTAIQLLQKISSYQNSSDKFKCLVESSNETLRILNSLNLTSEIGADDIFPISLYIFVKAKIPNLFSLFKFLTDFLDEVVLDSEQSYRFTNFELALDFIDKLDVNLRDENNVFVPISVFEDRLEKCIYKILQEAKKNHTVAPRLLWLSGLFIECGSIDAKKGSKYSPKSMEIFTMEECGHYEEILSILGLKLVNRDKTFDIIYEKAYPQTVYFLLASALENMVERI